jgi:hypothetical protein
MEKVVKKEMDMEKERWKKKTLLNHKKTDKSR